MERLTNAMINVSCACLLFIVLFSACSKKPQANQYEQEKTYARASKEIEQGHKEQPVASYVSAVVVRKIPPQHVSKDSVTAVTEKSFHQTKRSQKQKLVDSVIYSENPSYQPASEQVTKQAAAESPFLKWFRLLAFFPIAIALVLMQKIVQKGKRNQQGTAIVGGLISILLVVLLIVLILALI